MASMAYSTWCSLPSGEKVVVLWSYLLDMLTAARIPYFTYSPSHLAQSACQPICGTG